MIHLPKTNQTTLISRLSDTEAVSPKKRRQPRGKLDTLKCEQCRHDKQKCLPIGREWPQRCKRCEQKDFQCSPNERKRKASRRNPNRLDSPTIKANAPRPSTEDYMDAHLTSPRALSGLNNSAEVQDHLMPHTMKKQQEQGHHSRLSSALITLNQQANMIAQQRTDTQLGLALGPEKLGLNSSISSTEYISPRSRIPRMQTSVDGTQDSGEYHHMPMKHDWKSSPYPHIGGPGPGRLPSVGAYSTPSPLSGAGGHATPPSQGFGVGGRSMSPYGPPNPGSSHGGGILTAPSLHSSHSMNPGSRRPLGDDRYHLTTKTCEPTCPLDALLIDFLAERRQRAAEGLSASEVIGPRYPSVSSLLNPAQCAFSHPLSKVFTDILAAFPDISALPERVAMLYVMFLIMRWQVSPNRENYERLPPWARPIPIQIEKSHPAWIDYFLPFPEMRQRLVENYNPRDYLFDNFFVPYTTTLSLNWPYEDTLTILQSLDGNELVINPVFEHHLMNLDNWTLGHKFENAFPSLVGTFRAKESWRRRMAKE